MDNILGKPKYNVERDDANNTHLYRVSTLEGRLIGEYPGVTSFLGIIGGEKTNRLMGWAAKESLAKVEMALTNRLSGKKSKKITLNDDWILDVIAEARKRPKKALSEAADYGTRLHAAIEFYIAGKAPVLDDETRDAFEVFKNTINGLGFKFIAPEIRCASIQHGYGCTFDALAERKGKLILLDWKTSKNLYDSAGLQLAANERALYETYGVSCHECWAVKFPKAPPHLPEFKMVPSIPDSLAAFLDAKRLYEAMKRDHLVTPAGIPL